MMGVPMSSPARRVGALGLCALLPAALAQGGGNAVTFFDGASLVLGAAGGSAALAARTNYTLGYRAAVAGDPTTDRCYQVAPFRFTSDATGTLTALTITVVPHSATAAETCNVNFWLYSYPSNALVGTMLSVSHTEAAGGSNPLETSSIAIPAANAWSITAGQQYYFVIDSFTWAADGTHCAMDVPYAVVPGFASLLGLQHAALGVPCGGSAWGTDLELPGGVLAMLLQGTGNLAASPSPSPSPTPTLSVGSTPSPSFSPTPTRTPSLSYTAPVSGTPSPTPTIGPPVVFLDTLAAGAVQVDGDFVLGYVNNTGSGGTVNRCNQISKFVFPSLATGIVTSADLLVIPHSATVAESCNLNLWLYDMTNVLAGVQVGSTVTVLHNEAASSASTEDSVFSVASGGWTLTAGHFYFLTIDSFTWAADGTHCAADLPWGTASSQYSVATQFGVTGSPCGSAWTNSLSRTGAAIQMRLSGNGIAGAPSATASSSAAPGAPSATASPTPTPSGTRTGGTASSSSVPSASTSLSPSPTPSQTPTPTASLSTGSSPSITPSPSSTPSVGAAGNLGGTSGAAGNSASAGNGGSATTIAIAVAVVACILAAAVFVYSQQQNTAMLRLLSSNPTLVKGKGSAPQWGESKNAPQAVAQANPLADAADAAAFSEFLRFRELQRLQQQQQQQQQQQPSGRAAAVAMASSDATEAQHASVAFAPVPIVREQS
jgi:hypothetical protein